jgi:hypothetical protein
MPKAGVVSHAGRPPTSTLANVAAVRLPLSLLQNSQFLRPISGPHRSRSV